MGGVLCGCGDVCCLYPWPGIDEPLYPDSDLPDSVVFNGDTLNHVGAYSFVGDTYRMFAGIEAWEIHLISTNELIQFQPCLIGDGVTDQFSNTYLFSIITAVSNVTRTCTITRVSTCRWEGSIEFENGDWIPDGGAGTFPVFVSYPSPESLQFGWGYNIALPVIDGGPLGGDKDDPQSSPLGIYGTIAEVS